MLATNILITGIMGILGMIIMAFAVYVTFYPLTSTIRGGISIVRLAFPDQGTVFITDSELGLTMADGGKSTD